MSYPEGHVERFAAARDIIDDASKSPLTHQVSLQQQGKVRMTLEAYESIAATITNLQPEEPDVTRTSQQNPLPISARHLTVGDYFFDWMVSSWQRIGSTKEFTLITPGRANGFTLTVKAEKLDDVVFPVHKRGDSHSPTARNRAMGLPDDLDRPEPPKPAEPIEIYPAGTRMENVRYFDRGMHILFKCPEHPASAWSSKDPFCSSIFPQSDSTRDCAPECRVTLHDYVLTHEYRPTRNG